MMEGVNKQQQSHHTHGKQAFYFSTPYFYFIPSYFLVMPPMILWFKQFFFISLRQILLRYIFYQIIDTYHSLK